MRAQQTWDLASAELGRLPDRRDSEQLYTFDRGGVLEMVRALPDDVRTVALVGHNPAFEEVVGLLTGRSVELQDVSDRGRPPGVVGSYRGAGYPRPPPV